MNCRLVNSEPLRVSSFESFKRLCLKRYMVENEGLAASALIYGCRKCETGKAIMTGKLKQVPDNVGLINLAEERTMETTSTKGKEVRLPVTLSDKVLVDKNFEEMKAADLRPYWLPLIPHSHKVGQCVNCSRDLHICACGLCSACYRATAGLTGAEMLNSLVMIAAEVTAEIEASHMPDEVAVAADQPVTNSIPGDQAGLVQEKILEPVPRQLQPLVVGGYEPLHQVLCQALDQAQHGKGKERHANNLPFINQPIMIETRSVGLGFPAGQARKKILEAINCSKDQPDRAIADLLGAINYAAAAVLGIMEQRAANSSISQSEGHHA